MAGRRLVVATIAAAVWVGGCSAAPVPGPADTSSHGSQTGSGPPDTSTSHGSQTGTGPAAVASSRPVMAPDSFYEWGGPVPAGSAGEILRSLELAGNDEIRVWAVLYRSTGLDGSAVVVSGTIAVPTSPPPAGGRRVIAWAHGTVGIADACAPSRQGPDSGLPSQWVPFVQAGFVVTATDYEGLGTPGVHPYGVGLSEGRSILDSVRAARRLPGAAATGPVALAGHSEGGHGVLWAAEIVGDYAPEVKVAAVLASAPGGDLLAAAKDLDQQTSLPASKNLQLLVRSWQSVYQLPVDTIMDSGNAELLAEADTRCLEDLSGVSVRAAFAADPDWAPHLSANSPAGRHIAAPILYLQGTADDQLPIAVAHIAVHRLCQDGDAIEYREFPGEGHNDPLFKPGRQQDAVNWISDRIAGKPPTNTCK